MNFFEKPIEAITVDDLNWLISAEVQESQDIDYKRELSGEKSAPDPWQSTGEKINGAAVAALVKELVAFANTQGGSLILGMDQTEEAPPRAKCIEPIRSVADLAEILKRRCRDNIEPPLYGLDVRPLITQEDGAGVVVFRVASSPHAPHRSKCDRQCYLRRNDDSVPMTMDDIQRRVVEMSQRQQTLDSRFKALALPPDATPHIVKKPRISMRVLALPEAPFFVPKIHKLKTAKPKIVPIPVRATDGAKYSGTFLCSAHNWEPILRGSEVVEKSTDRRTATLRIFSDGLVQFDWSINAPDDENHRGISFEWFIGLFGNALLAIERMRMTARTPSAEYSAEFQLAVYGNHFPLCDYGNGQMSVENYRFKEGVQTLGRYPVSGRDSFDEITRSLETDAYNLAGKDNPELTSFDYSNALAGLDADFKS